MDTNQILDYIRNDREIWILDKSTAFRYVCQGSIMIEDSNCTYMYVDSNLSTANFVCAVLFIFSCSLFFVIAFHADCSSSGLGEIEAIWMFYVFAGNHMFMLAYSGH